MNSHVVKLRSARLWTSLMPQVILWTNGTLGTCKCIKQFYWYIHFIDMGDHNVFFMVLNQLSITFLISQHNSDFSINPNLKQDHIYLSKHWGDKTFMTLNHAIMSQIHICHDCSITIFVEHRHLKSLCTSLANDKMTHIYWRKVFAIWDNIWYVFFFDAKPMIIHHRDTS